MIFWPCCCPGTACFKPCECFQRGCELHITSSGWTDNAATDCGGIADRVFNKTHVFTINNIVGTAYGYDCEFTVSYDDLILTKLPGGGCICKTQPALYNIEGTLGCTRNEEGGYNLTIVLHFNVPVYDEDEGCSPSPCTLEPKWETWTANYELVSGGSSSAPPCDLGPDPLGPYTFNTTPSAQTTCGFGLDGTNAEFTLEWKFCDPSGGCYDCCNQSSLEDLPDSMQLVISGVVDDECDQCNELLNGTFVLERVSGTCIYALSLPESDFADFCDINPLFPGVQWDFLNFRYSVGFTGDGLAECTKALTIDFSAVTPFQQSYIASFCDQDSYGDGIKCNELDEQPMTACDLGIPIVSDVCDFSGATVTITALP